MGMNVDEARKQCLAVSANNLRSPGHFHIGADSIDPTGQVRFLSDGNLEFARTTGLIESHPDYFLGDRLKRFVMITQDAVVEHLGVENTLLTLSCSRVDDVFLRA